MLYAEYIEAVHPLAKDGEVRPHGLSAQSNSSAIHNQPKRSGIPASRIHHNSTVIWRLIQRLQDIFQSRRYEHVGVS